MKGLCKDEFDEWLENLKETNLHLGNIDNVIGFHILPSSMQIGVLIDYFDSVGLDIDINCCDGFVTEVWIEDKQYLNEFFQNRTEARAKAIEKACELRNKQLEK